MKKIGKTHTHTQRVMREYANDESDGVRSEYDQRELIAVITYALEYTSVL